jgi:lactoylglutathione lyase
MPSMIKTSIPTIVVADIDRSVAFYTSALGFKAGDRNENFAVVHAPGMTLGLHPDRGHTPKNARQGNMSIGFEVEDMEAAVKHLAANGVTCNRFENEANKFALFTDPDGTGLYLIQPKTKQ